MNITYQAFDNRYVKDILSLQNEWVAENITYGFCADEEEEILRYDKAYFQLAFDGDRVVGYVCAEVRKNEGESYMNIFPQGENYLQILDLYISPAYRNQNIGAVLLHSVEERAKKNGVSHLFLSSATKDAESVRRFYQRNGYRIWTTAFFK